MGEKRACEMRRGEQMREENGRARREGERRDDGGAGLKTRHFYFLFLTNS